jgi:hypothetical protein
MANAGAAIDPVFWPHHSNVDRFWDRWARLNPDGTPDVKEWLAAELPGLCNGKGESLKLTVADTLGGKLGYKYDDTDGPAEMKPSSKWRVRAVEGMTPDKDAWATGVGMNVAKLSVPNDGARKAFADAVDPKAKHVRVRVQLGGFKSGIDPRLALEVYLFRQNADIEKLSPESPGYITTVFVAMFDDHDGPEHLPTVLALDATRALRRLYPKGYPERGPDFSVACIPAAIGEKKWEGKLSDVIPGRTRIDILYRDE